MLQKWCKFSRMGQPVADLFVPFKAPLKPSVAAGIQQKYWFTVDDLLSAYSNIGLVIDLTGSPRRDRYYHEDDFTGRSIQHVKLVIKGFGEMPPEKDVERFMDIVDDYHFRNPNKLIGVHCTHGLNRTGFMICKYLSVRRNMVPEAALSMFQEARGHQIERQVYVNEILATIPGHHDESHHYRHSGQSVFSGREYSWRRKSPSKEIIRQDHVR